jgi:heme oxygenase
MLISENQLRFIIKNIISESFLFEDKTNTENSTGLNKEETYFLLSNLHIISEFCRQNFSKIWNTEILQKEKDFINKVIAEINKTVDNQIEEQEYKKIIPTLKKGINQGKLNKNYPAAIVISNFSNAAFSPLLTSVENKLSTNSPIFNEIKKIFVKNKKGETTETEGTGIVENIIKVLDLCKNKLKNITWNNEMIELQKTHMLRLIDNDSMIDSTENFLKKQNLISNLIKSFYGSPLEILLQNLTTNKKIFNDETGEIIPTSQQPTTKTPLINLINDTSKHEEIVSRLISTVKYRQKNEDNENFLEENTKLASFIKIMDQIYIKQADINKSLPNRKSGSTGVKDKISNYASKIIKQYEKNPNDKALDAIIKNVNTLKNATEDVIMKAL